MNIAAAFLEQNRERLDLGAFGIRAGHSCLILTPRFEASRHVVFLLMPHGRSEPTLVVKVPRLIEATGSLAREAESLRRVQTLRPDGFASVPRVVALEEYRGRLLLVETAVNGPLMSPAVIRRQPADCCSRILDWLIDLQQASLRTGDGTWFANIVEDPLRYFAETFPVREDEAAMIARTRDIVAPLRNAGLPFVCEHGDLSHPNLILRGRGVGIIDWELAQMDGLVAYDLFIFLSYVAVSLRRANSTDARLDAFHDAFFSAGAWTLPLVRSYAIRLHLPADALAPLFVWSWARYTINLLRRITDGDSPPGSRVERATADSLRSHRYYRMWRHAVTNVHRLSWGG